MSGMLTRRAFVGGGIAFAAGAGVRALPLGASSRSELRLRATGLVADVPAPPFGALTPTAVAPGRLSGDLRDRSTGRRVGRLLVASVGTARVHSLDLARGSLLAAAPGGGRVLDISGGTRAYAGASGRITIHDTVEGGTSLDLDVDLEL